MSADELIAYGAVVCATAYAGWRLLPAGWRAALAQRFSRLAQRAGLLGAAPRVQAGPSGHTACHTCSACPGCADKGPATAVHTVAFRKTAGRSS